MVAMSAASPVAGDRPNVQHQFDGEVQILNSTHDRRMEIRKTLSALQSELRSTEGVSVQVVTGIKMRISGTDGREHMYTVTVEDASFDNDAFAQQGSFVIVADPSSKPLNGSSSSSVVVDPNGRRRSDLSTTLNARKRVPAADDDIMETQAPKNSRLDVQQPLAEVDETSSTNDIVRQALAILQRHDNNEVLDFAKAWRSEW